MLFQLDVEMSFVTQDDIKNLIEALLKHCWPAHFEPLCLPLPRMSYAEAIQQYGTDKPDTRYGNLVIVLLHSKVCRYLLLILITAVLKYYKVLSVPLTVHYECKGWPG